MHEVKWYQSDAHMDQEFIDFATRIVRLDHFMFPFLIGFPDICFMNDEMNVNINAWEAFFKCQRFGNIINMQDEENSEWAIVKFHSTKLSHMCQRDVNRQRSKVYDVMCLALEQ